MNAFGLHREADCVCRAYESPDHPLEPMYLKSLRINGFKSFADATLLSFQPGVTAIVGPNGCGKSNIADAIRWVLGEQSAKALRGGKMQDVIFEGTDDRKPLQFCEVSLVLAECEAQLGAEFHEVEILRRVTRDGASDYFLNGKTCRLKDIQKLFMDTGLGRSSYSVMAQGQIDQILSSRPEERREIFEEAAGITRYKAQRREAMNKLAATEANLTRVKDVMGEITRQIGSLRRQAAKALRYRRLAERLRHLDLARLAVRTAALRRTAEEGEAHVVSLGALLSSARSELDAARTRLDERRRHRVETHKRLQEIQQMVFDLRSQREQAENAAQVAAVRRDGVRERLASAERELAALDAELRETGEKADSEAQVRRAEAARLEECERDFQQRSAEIRQIESSLAANEQKLQRLKLVLLEAESQVVRLRAEMTNLEVEQRAAESRKARLDLESREAAEAEARARETHAHAAARAAEAESAAEEHRLSTEQTRSTLASAQAMQREAQRRAAEAERALQQKSARQTALRQLADQFEGYSEGARVLLQGRLPEGVAREDVAALSRRFRIPKGWSRALEALLGPAAEALAVPDLAAARRLVAHLVAGQVGRAGFAAASFPTQAPVNTVQAPPGLRRAADVFLPAEGAHPAARRLLEGCYVADSLDAAAHAVEAYPDFSYSIIATLSGEWIDGRGLVFGGPEKGRGNVVLAREAELAEIEAEISAGQAALDAARSSVEQAERAVEAATQALEEARRVADESARSLATLQAEERAAARVVQDAALRAARLAAEARATHHEATEALQRLERLRVQSQESAERAVQASQDIALVERQIAGERGQREQARDALAAARLDLAERRQRVELLDRGLSDLSRRRADLSRRRNETALSIDAWNDQATRLDAEQALQGARVRELARTLEIAQESALRAREAAEAAEAEAAEAESGIRGLQDRCDGLQRELGALEVKLAETRAAWKFLVEEAQREYATDPALVDWRRALWTADQIARQRSRSKADDEDDPDFDPPVEVRGEPGENDLRSFEAPDWDAIASEVETLRSRLQGMGPVSLTSIEEYRELQQRSDFYTRQTEDLVRSRTELLDAIEEINRVSQRQFQETFEQVRKNFEYTFVTLFGGGRVELQLVENPAEPLESGIEIVAQPPGTKLKGITLLSGGQRALTAVALLFAIYLVKPSPFCLLDELDAPLDESNIGRFTHLLRQFSSGSQFLIITHNKRTIASAQAIYGVTMEERGVSKVVSMKLQGDRQDGLTVDQLIASGPRPALATSAGRALR